MTAATATMSFGERAKLWGVAVRAYSFPAHSVPILLGTAYAWYETSRAGAPRFSLLLLVLTLIAGALYHIAVNLINDYYDFLKGVDRPGTFGGSGVLVAGTMTPRQVITGAYTCIALGSAIGVYLVWRLSTAAGGPYENGWPLLVIGLVGLFGTLWYTASRGSAKYNALGNPLVFLMFGPGYVLGTYVIQAQPASFPWNALWISIPVGFLVAAILQANDVRDIADDREAGIRTIATQLGAMRARMFYHFEVIAPYIGVIALVALRILPWPCLAVLLTLPLALPLIKVFATVLDEKSEQLMPTVENTAKLHMAFGMLLTIGVIVGKFIG